MEDVDTDFCFPCTKCQTGFTSLRDLRKHKCSTEDKLKNQKEPKLMQCHTKNDKVGTTYSSNGDAQNNFTDMMMKMEDPLALLSQTDNCEIDTKENLRQEGDNKPSQDSYGLKVETKHECPICGMGLPYGILEKHIAYHRKKGTADCEINECERQFSNKKLLKTHQLTEHGANTRKCHICNYDAKCSTTLQKHLLKHTGEKPFVCSECGDRYKTTQGLEGHIKRHKNVFDYPCDKCESKFVSKETLKQHISAMHTKREPIVCDECGRGFKYKINYKEHIKLHTGVKDLKCRFCDKVFRRQAARFKHERVHKGVKHHECKICDKKFMQRDHLTVHIKMHLNQKDYKCHQCGKGFIEPGGLRKHKCQHANRESGEVYFEKGSNSQLLKNINSPQLLSKGPTKPVLKNYLELSLLFKENPYEDIQIQDF